MTAFDGGNIWSTWFIFYIANVGDQMEQGLGKLYGQVTKPSNAAFLVSSWEALISKEPS